MKAAAPSLLHATPISLLLWVTFLLAILHPSSGTKGKIVSKEASNVSTTQEASYSCNFINLWNSKKHGLYPEGSAHWSAPVMVPHNSDYTLWADGKKAGPGITKIAEVSEHSQYNDTCDVCCLLDTESQ
jgi:hypothetical protein